MRGIETAFEGTLGRDPELKTSKGGKPFASLNLAVTAGKADDGSDATTWVRVVCFCETAQEIAAAVAKGDRVYVEGSLTLGSWTAADGEQRAGLNVAAWKCKPLGMIGEKRPKQARKPSTHAQSDNGAANKGAGRDFNDPLPF